MIYWAKILNLRCISWTSSPRLIFELLRSVMPVLAHSGFRLQTRFQPQKRALTVLLLLPQILLFFFLFSSLPLPPSLPPPPLLSFLPSFLPPFLPFFLPPFLPSIFLSFLLSYFPSRSSQARNSVWAAAVTYATAVAMADPLTHCARLGIKPTPLQWLGLLQADS